jgi:hypothetical protein
MSKHHNNSSNMVINNNGNIDDASPDMDEDERPGAVAMGDSHSGLVTVELFRTISIGDENDPTGADSKTSDSDMLLFSATAVTDDDDSLHREVEELRQPVQYLQDTAAAVATDAAIAVPSRVEDDEIVGDFGAPLRLKFLKRKCFLYPFLAVTIVVVVVISLVETTKKDDKQAMAPTNDRNYTPSATSPPATPPPFTPPSTSFAGCPDSLGPLELGAYLFDQNTTYAPPVDLTQYITSYNDPDCAISNYSAVSRGLWYTVVGTGDRLMVTTCADFYHRITVLDGTSNCSKGNGCIRHSHRLTNYGCFGGRGLQWESDIGRVYYIAVHGDDNDWSNSGSFDLRFGKVAENDLCEGATSVPLNSTIEGDSSFASQVDWDSYDEAPPYPEAETCLETGIGDDEYQYLHGGYAIQGSAGVWYKLQLDSDRWLRATTSCEGNEDEGFLGTHIVVFSGSCSELQCVGTSLDIAANDADFSCSENSVSWFSKAGETYFIHIHGIRDGDSTAGKFALLVTAESDTVQTRPPIDDPTNEFCIDAIGPLKVGESVQGSTDGALNTHAARCGGATAQLGSGVWYLVQGTGETMVLSTCPPGGEYWSENDFYKQISVFEGPCDGLVCIDGGSYVSHLDHSLCFGSAGATWDSVEGKDYYALVHGQFFGSSGNFNLYLDVAPSNYECQHAIPLQFGSVVEGTTLYGESQNVAQCGEASGQESNGNWYTIINEESVAKAIIATTCTIGKESSANVQISVFRGGDCNSLLCVDGSNSTDPEGNCVSKEAGVAWLAEPKVIYRILVHHLDWNDVGSFSLEVRETELSIEPLPPPPANDLCSGAIELPQEGLFLFGTTDGADYDRGVNPDLDSPGVWYWFVGRGEHKNIYIEEVDDGPSFTVDVFKSDTASCNDLAEIEYSYYDGFDAEEGARHYILVYSRQNKRVGDFWIWA